MNEMNLYRSLFEHTEDCDAILATVIDGPEKGDKLLVMGGQILTCDAHSGTMHSLKEESFFHELNLESLCLAENFKVLEVDGRSIFVLRLGKTPRLILCGYGHVGAALLPLATSLGFECWVIDDRPECAEQARLNGAKMVYCGDYRDILKGIPNSSDNYYVCMTRGHRYDEECLSVIMERSFAYVGMMASKRRAILMRESLLEMGRDADSVGRLCSPIGVDIDAQTPMEIAVSVAGELIRFKNRNQSRSILNPLILEELANHTTAFTHVLCTILNKNGSAPREPGTQMLVCSDGRVIGTIGGGIVEANLIADCKALLKSHGESFQVERQMTAEDTGDSGVICGGRVRIFVELI